MKNKSKPYFPPDYDASDMAAIKALNAGTATDRQQKHALKWIIEVASATYDMPFRPGGEDGRRDTDFACGRAFVGHMILKMLAYDARIFKQDKKEMKNVRR